MPNRKPTANLNFIDKTIMYFNPQNGLKRTQARLQHQTLANGGYIGADTSRRSMRSANTLAGSSDSDDIPSLNNLRAISRDMDRNGPIPRGAIDTMRYNILGSGLRVQSQIDYEFLGFTVDEARAWESKAERIFKFWAESENADVERTSNFYELQTIALIGTFVSGDIFTAMPYIDRKDSPYSLALQLIEADRVSNPNNAMDSKRIAGGIENDALGAPTHYHITKFHPGDLGLANSWKKVPVFGTSGRRNILHTFEKRRPGQRRGISLLAPVIEPLKQLTDYTHAELTAAVVSGMFTVFIETPEGEAAEGLDAEAQNYQPDEMKMEAGAILGLAGGEKVTTANPNRPNTAFDPFTQAVLKQIGAALNLPFEVLMKHFTASYSASRGALLEAWKMFRTRRTWFSQKFTQPVYEALLTEAVLLGHLNAPGFLEDPMVKKAYCGASWNGPAQGQLNPVNETKAAISRVEEGFSTRTKEASEINGTDYDQNIKRAQTETNQLRSSGLYELKNPQVETEETPKKEDDE